ncbi:MAG: flagellin [Clostridiales bacterium]|nr:flagellin [Clostridiales bacterium]
MRIQHNVTALNSYRNLRGNNSALSKNLEKLSSGYRINRAGDDAAGLAVSEKMRAQIRGLETAEKNAQDGISLVQTAEGALTEVHSMLNRMVELATQSANGTYDNAVDRKNLQSEVASLKNEIDRISQASNYNGIKLLDGSMSNKAMNTKAPEVKGSSLLPTEDIKAQAGEQELKFAATTATNGPKEGGKFAVSINYKEGTGAEKVKTFEFDVVKNGTKLEFQDKDGNVMGEAAATTGVVTDAEISALTAKAINQDADLKKIFTADGAAATMKLAAKEKGLKGGEVVGATAYATKADGALAIAADAYDKAEVKVVKDRVDAGHAYDFSKNIVFGDDEAGTNHGIRDTEDINKAIFEVNGEKFVFVNNGLTKSQWDAVVKSGAHHVSVNAAAAAPADVDVKEMARKIEDVTGLKATQGEVGTGANAGKFTEDATKKMLKFDNAGKAEDKSLTLQIGDTADAFNKMKVSIQAMDVKSLGIDGVDVSTQDGASVAVDKIKNAINSVSSTRGDLGALQNRLEHTINNLGVMTENITDAESRIRDTDMAKEMMAYTKNNILMQASQAMLAQANQIPQGVLQLLG